MPSTIRLHRVFAAKPDKLYREWERKRAGGNTYRS